MTLWCVTEFLLVQSDKMKGVGRLVLTIQCVGILSLVRGTTSEVSDGEGIIDALTALQSYVNDLHDKQVLLTEEMHSVKTELREQRLLTRQCLQHLTVPNNHVNPKTRHRDRETASSPNVPYRHLQTRPLYRPDNYSKSIKTDIYASNTSHDNNTSNTRNIATNHSSREGRHQSDRHTRVSGSTSGRVAFTALANNVNNLGANQVIHFPNVLTNNGNFYNQHTGVFTCGVAGTYVFYMSILGGYQSRVQAALVKDDIAIIHTHSPQIAGEYGNANNMVVIPLQVGDSIWVKTIDIRTNQNVHEWSTFSGFLLYPDF